MSRDYEQYLIQAKRNEKLVFYLQKNCLKEIFFNWIFVVIFYSALQYFYAFLAYKGKKIPEAHKGRKDYNIGKIEGGIDMAENIFFTTKNGISDSVGLDYKQLFQWCYDVRYKPNRSNLISLKEFYVALGYLDGIKLVTFNEIGYMPKVANKKIKIETVKKVYLTNLYNKRKKGNF